MFHDIVRRKDVWFDTTVEEFRAQLEAIRAAGATPITIDQFHEHLKNGAPLPAKPILLTFDDGYLGHLENAYPLLKEFNYPAVFFVHTAYVGVLTGKPHMDWDQIKQIDSEGLVSIQSHTITHPADLRTSTPPLWSANWSNRSGFSNKSWATPSITWPTRWATRTSGCARPPSRRATGFPSRWIWATRANPAACSLCSGSSIRACRWRWPTSGRWPIPAST